MAADKDFPAFEFFKGGGFNWDASIYTVYLKREISQIGICEIGFVHNDFIKGFKLSNIPKEVNITAGGKTIYKGALTGVRRDQQKKFIYAVFKDESFILKKNYVNLFFEDVDAKKIIEDTCKSSSVSVNVKGNSWPKYKTFSLDNTVIFDLIVDMSYKAGFFYYYDPNSSSLKCVHYNDIESGSAIKKESVIDIVESFHSTDHLYKEAKISQTNINAQDGKDEQKELSKNTIYAWGASSPSFTERSKWPSSEQSIKLYIKSLHDDDKYQVQETQNRMAINAFLHNEKVVLQSETFLEDIGKKVSYSDNRFPDFYGGDYLVSGVELRQEGNVFNYYTILSRA